MPVIPAHNEPTHVEIQPGTEPGPHQLTSTEVFLVLGGEVDVRLGDEVVRASAGDTIIVLAQTPFALTVCGDEAFRAHVCMPVDGQAVLDDGKAFTPPWAQ